MAQLDEAIKLNPKDAQAYYERGLLHQKAESGLGNDERFAYYAMYLPRVGRTPSESVLPPIPLGVSPFELDAEPGKSLDKIKSIADFTEAIKLDSKFARAFIGRAQSYQAACAYEKSIADFSEAIKLEPKDPLGTGCY